MFSVIATKRWVRSSDWLGLPGSHVVNVTIANTACASEAGVSRQASPLDTQSLTAVARL